MLQKKKLEAFFLSASSEGNATDEQYLDLDKVLYSR